MAHGSDIAMDVLSIDNLMGTYAAVSDSGFRADGYEPLWVEDCEVTVGNDIHAKGKCDVLKLLASLAKSTPWAFHQFSRETLNFSDDRNHATCVWSVLAHNTTLGSQGPVAMMATGRYRCALVKSDSQWRIRSAHTEFYNISQWREGWVPSDAGRIAVQ